MALPLLLVSGYHYTPEQSALFLVDLEGGTARVLSPYPGPIHATTDTLFLARFLGGKTRIEKYDRGGLCWMKRVADCTDTHSVTPVGDELAICSTGTNEVIFLDAEGTERRRWSPDAAAEPDSWHLNSLHGHEGRLYVSCFGRFRDFRGWSGRVEGAGMILDVATGQAVVQGLSGPHDPNRVPGGWIVNNSHVARLIHVPDDGPRETLMQAPGFPRGLLVRDDHFILGVSCPRQPGWPTGNARVLVIDRSSRQTIASVALPCAEIGHVIAAPAVEVLEAMYQEQARALPCLLPQRGAIEVADRVGSVTARGSLQHEASSGCYLLFVQVVNRGRVCWATENDKNVNISYQIVNAEGGVLHPEGIRTRLPLPLGPGKSMTFPMRLDLTICHHLPAAAAARITLVQEGVAWWEASADWSPAVVPLPPELRTPPPGPSTWRANRGRRALPF